MDKHSNSFVSLVCAMYIDPSTLLTIKKKRYPELQESVWQFPKSFSAIIQQILITAAIVEAWPTMILVNVSIREFSTWDPVRWVCTFFHSFVYVGQSSFLIGIQILSRCSVTDVYASFLPRKREICQWSSWAFTEQDSTRNFSDNTIRKKCSASPPIW